MGTVLAVTSRTTYDKPIGSRQRNVAIGTKPTAIKTRAEEQSGGNAEEILGARDFHPESAIETGRAAEESKADIRYGTVDGLLVVKGVPYTKHLNPLTILPGFTSCIVRYVELYAGYTLAIGLDGDLEIT